MLAANGWGVAIPDLFGTGDSTGDFGDARWDIWLQDIEAAAAWLGAQGRRRQGLWAMRTGALLAAEFLSRKALSGPLLLWQPVVQGKTFLTQFLRVALAANLITADGTSGSVDDFRGRLGNGESLEIAGYVLHPDLAAALDTARLDLVPQSAPPIHWLEISSAAPALSPGSRRMVAALKDTGVAVAEKGLTGPQFWMMQEPEWADALVEASRQTLADTADV